MKVSEGDKRPLSEIRNALLEESANRFQGKRHDITTNSGLVNFLNEAINAFVHGSGTDNEIVSREAMNTLGYVCGAQLKAIAAVQAEENPAGTIADLLGAAGSIQITMTKEERKMYLTSGSVDKMTKVLEAVKRDGRVVELEPQADGSYSIPPRAYPPRTECPMPIVALKDALNVGGVDINRREVLEIFGNSLGTGRDGEDVELFGFDTVFDVEPKNEPMLGHTWKTVTVENENMPGIVVRKSECTKCGIRTNNTSKLLNDECKVIG